MNAPRGVVGWFRWIYYPGAVTTVCMTVNTDRYAAKPLREINLMPRLLDRIEEAPAPRNTPEAAEAWSWIIDDYITWGNRKIANSVGIFNLNSAHDCPNRETDNCQVPWESCYAGKTENQYGSVTLPFRRRQEFLWDYLTYDTEGAALFANALCEIINRKRNDVTAIRFSEAGDVRANSDIIYIDKIGEIMAERGIDVYLYSASDYLNWELAENFTVNASNDNFSHANRRYTALPSDADLPEGAIWCPHDRQKQNGVEEPIKCGDCRACIIPEGPDVYIPLQHEK